MRRLLFINRSYWPDAEATGQLLTDLCESLAGEFDVTVVAGQPHANLLAEEFCKSGMQVRNDVKIRRVRHTRFRKQSLIGRVFNFLTFFFSASFRSLWLKRPDVVVVETDPFLLPFLGLLLKWRYRCRLLVYLQDLQPDIAVRVGKVRNNLIVRALRRMLFWVYKHSTAVIVLSEDMKSRLTSRGIHESKITIIPNWADSTRITPVKSENSFRDLVASPGRLVVMYSGNHGLCQGLEQLFPQLIELSQSLPIDVVMVGQGVLRPHLEGLAIRAGADAVQFHDYQPRSQLAVSLSAADVHLLPVDERISDCLMPSKFYGILASGTAILAITSSETELARVIVTNEIGCVVPPGDCKALHRALEWFIASKVERTQMGMRARRLAETTYTRESSIQLFRNLIHGTENSGCLSKRKKRQQRSLVHSSDKDCDSVP